MHKFISIRQAMKIPDVKAAANKECEKLEKCQHDQSKEQERGIRRGTVRATNNSFCYADGHLSSQKFEVGTEISEIRKSRCDPWWHCQLWLFRSIYRAGFVNITKDGRKRNWCHVQDNQPMQHQHFPETKWWMLLHYGNIPRQSVRIFGYVYHDTSG